MTPKDVLEAVAAFLAILGILWAASKTIFAPHVEKAVGKIIDDKVGPQLEALPTLTHSVNRLTDAIAAQSKETERITGSFDALVEKVDGNAAAVGELTERTIAVEKDVEHLKRTTPVVSIRSRRGKRS